MKAKLSQSEIGKRLRNFSSNLPTCKGNRLTLLAKGEKDYKLKIQTNKPIFRQEMAQIKREEKRRTEKERMLAESDPDKQRRWEEKEYKRELKRKVPKMKQLKVKAM